MKNEYKQIPSFPMFEICDTVNPEFAVRYKKTHRYCVNRLSSNNYYRVYLPKSMGGSGKEELLHRLIAETYLGPCPEGMECDHIDTNKLNYNHLNLRYVTRKENINNPLTLKHKSKSKKDYYSNIENRKKQSEKRKQYFSNIENRKKHAKAMSKSILQIDKISGKIINIFNSAKEVENILKINHGNISSCCNGKRKSAGGYFWKFK